MKYPLTDEAKAAARYLVSAWDKNIVFQQFEIHDVTAGGSAKIREFSGGIGTDNDFSVPEINTLMELS